MKKLNGVTTALITPFTKNGMVDEDGLGVLIERQIAAGVDGVCVTAGSGEFANTTAEEHARVVKLSVGYAKGRVPIIAGVFACNTADALASSQKACSLGADALLVLSPLYNRPSPEGMKLYYKTIADGVDKPILVYNNQGRTGVDIASMYELFLDIDKIIGTKECNRDMGVFSETMLKMGGKWNSILSGDEDIFYTHLCLGGHGAIMTTSNIEPGRWVKLYKAFMAGDHATAVKIHYEMLPLLNAVYTLNHPALVKKCMAMMGLPAGTTRSPLVEPTKAQVGRIAEVIEKMNLK